MADRGVWTKAELHQMKMAGMSSDSVAGKFPWAKPQHVVRFGNNYAVGERCGLDVAGRPLIRLSKNEAGLMGLSFLLKNQEGRCLALMDDNDFEARSNDLYDLSVNASATSIRIRDRKRSVLLDIRFHRPTYNELKKFIQVDWGTSPFERDLYDWVERHAIDDEGRVPFLDFQNTVMYAGSTGFKIKSGILVNDGGSSMDKCLAIESILSL